MGKIRFTEVCLILTVALFAKAEVICDKVRPLKPVRCVCGKLIDPTGGPVSGAMVKVAKDGIDVATMKTDGDGSFIFGELKSGNYELTAHAEYLVPFQSPIVVAYPAKQCKHGLLIMLVTSYPDNCGSRAAKRIAMPRRSN
jgi:hypothetical protein